MLCVIYKQYCQTNVKIILHFTKMARIELVILIL